MRETYLWHLKPVCPNCHMILHSKPGGFYSAEEVKDMIENRTNLHKETSYEKSRLN